MDGTAAMAESFRRVDVGVEFSCNGNVVLRAFFGGVNSLICPYRTQVAVKACISRWKYTSNAGGDGAACAALGSL